MTDDSRFRAPRAQGFAQQGLPQAQPAGARVRRTEDPLAELARLIGQEDPFADFVPHRPADGRAGGHAGAQRRPTQSPRDARTPDPRGLDRRRPAPPLRTSEALDDHDLGAEQDESLRAENRYSYGAGRPAAAPRSLLDERPAPRPLARGTQERVAPGVEDEEHTFDQQPRSPRDTRSARRAAADDDGYGEYAAEDYDPEYDDDAYLPAHGDEFYEEAPRRRLKGWLLVGVAAVAAIVVGTSGLFAYRAIFGTDQVAGPAKTISPDTTPTKMVPGSASQPADAQRSQDRIGGEPARSAERIVPREESPIDQSRIPQGGTADRMPGGTVTAAAPQFSPPPAAPAPSQAAPAPTVAPASISTEPRRVRTVTVRSDGSVVSGPGSTATPAAPPQASSPLALQGGQGAAALPPPRPGATTSAAPLRGDNPWATAPSGQVGTQAALPPQPQPQAAPAPAIAVNTPPPAGSYVVQVAAQKSEGEAQATWQALQQRYSGVLAGQQATIRRVDLGERGVFYRAQVGPFPSRAQASEVCQSLKAAGGECVIQRN